MIGRAETDEDKKRITDAILESWKQSPELRLGQLISNAIWRHAIWLQLMGKGKGASPVDGEIGVNLFYIEDDKLAEIASFFVREQ